MAVVRLLAIMRLSALVTDIGRSAAGSRLLFFGIRNKRA